MQTNIYRIMWLLAILVFTALACQALSGIQERSDDTRQTVEAAATKVQQGREFLETAQAVTTQIRGQSLLPTVQAMATQLSDSGVIETAKAVATEQGPGILATAKAIATQQGPAALETVQAYTTQFALSTPAADIPLIEGDKEMLIQSPNLVSYTTALPFEQALEYYKTQMPLFGWEKITTEGFETALAAFLRYQKGERKATINLGAAPAGGKLLVVILVEP